MILIWRGWGFLIIIAALFAMGTLGALLFHLLGLYTEHILYLPIIMIIAGAVIWYFGNRINKGEDRTYIDQETNEEIIISTKNHHTLFFIPIQYWGIIVGIIGILSMFLE